MATEKENVSDVLSGVLPKEEIGALRFLSRHPQYDGRGVRVAIFDSGVDPGAEGLQLTTTGEPKILNYFDCTGDGNVDMSSVSQVEVPTSAEASSDDVLFVKSLSGKVLLLPKSWNIPEKVHVGQKRAYDLFPAALKERMRKERKTTFDAMQRKALAELRSSIQSWDEEVKKNASAGQQSHRTDLDLRLAELEKMEWDDSGPVFDCISFFDGVVWRAAVDTLGTGDFRGAVLLSDFHRERQYNSFGDDSNLHYCVNIEEDGNCLSIVTDCSPHGTHVAGIVAGHYPDQRHLDGVAPGAQIVACKIGDARLDSEETMAALIRAMEVARRWQCDVINLSYGEDVTQENIGRFAEFAAEVVGRHGVAFVSAAGNNGPALSTAGTPGATVSSLIGVGAAVTPAMMKSAYSLVDVLPTMQFHWSSRGPTRDGALGVSISAPGGAIAPVPTWTLQRSQLINGTSMASPNACGAVALIISGLKQEKVPFSPFSIRRALENSAKSLPDVETLAQGHGLLQLDAAFELLLASKDLVGEELAFRVTVPTRGCGLPIRGLYIRELEECLREVVETVKVEPIFRDMDAEDEENHLRVHTNAERVAFEIPLTLHCEAEWVKAPEYVHLVNGGRSFQVKVDPVGISPGLHTTFVRALDLTHPSRPPLFTIPVVVLKPVLPLAGLESISLSELTGTGSLSPLRIHRSFIAVPFGATWATIDLFTEAMNSPQKCTMHALYLEPGVRFGKTEFVRDITLAGYSHWKESFRVTEGTTVEICLARNWANLEDVCINSVTVSFHGLSVNERRFPLHADWSDAVLPIEVVSHLRREQLDPSATLKMLRKYLRPCRHSLRVLRGARYHMLGGHRRSHELVLEYEFTLQQASEIIPSIPLFHEWLYDSPVDSQMWLLKDGNGQVIKWGDSLHEYKSPKLPRGSYTVAVCLQHDDPRVLERLKDLRAAVDRPLKSSEVVLPFYPTGPGQIVDGPRLERQWLEKGDRMTVFVALPEAAKLPSDAVAGDLLLGHVELSRSVGSASRFPLSIGVSTTASFVDATTPSRTSDPVSVTRNASSVGPGSKSVLADLKLNYIENVLRAMGAEDGGIVRVLDEVKKIEAEATGVECPDRLSLLSKCLAVKCNDGKVSLENLPEIAVKRGLVWPVVVEAADNVLKCAKESEEEPLLGRNCVSAIIIDALARKALALLCLSILESSQHSEKSTSEEKMKDGDTVPVLSMQSRFLSCMEELRKRADTTDVNKHRLFLTLHVAAARAKGQLGSALSVVNKYLSSTEALPSHAAHELRLELFEALGWSHWKRKAEVVTRRLCHWLCCLASGEHIGQLQCTELSDSFALEQTPS